jgi:hypothetical protein
MASPWPLTAAGANRHDSPLLAPMLEAAQHQLDHILPGDRTAAVGAGTGGPAATSPRGHRWTGWRTTAGRRTAGVGAQHPGQQV